MNRNMRKTIKLTPAIILFIFLLLIKKEFASSPPLYTKTTIKCTSSYDCPDCVIAPNYITSICEDGYCLELSSE
jgi:hypothetical protein